MAQLPEYKSWIAELEQGRTPTDLKHIGMTVAGRARFLINEIRSFEWPPAERAQVEALIARAKVIAQRRVEERYWPYHRPGH